MAIGDIWSGLDLFHGRVARSLVQRLDAEVDAEADRLQRRILTESIRTSSTIDQLAGIVDAQPSRPRDAASPEDRVLSACRAAAGAIGLGINASGVRSRGNDDLTAALKIAENARIRSRRLLLRADWWTNSAGPFVAFLGEERRAVAILPAGGGHIVFDPSTGRRTRLDGDIIGRLAPEAVMFYHGLPAGPLGLRDLLSMGMPMAWPDLARIALAALGLGVLSLATPLVTKLLIDSVLPRAEADQLMVCAAALIVVTLVSGGFQVMQGVAMLRLESRFDWILQAAIADRLLRMPVTFFRDYSAGDLADRALGIESVRAMVTSRAIRGMLALVSFVISLAAMIYLDPGLGLFAGLLASARLMVVIALSVGRLGHERSHLGMQGWLQGVILQFVTGIGKLRIANATVNALNVWVDRFSRQQGEFIASQRAANLLRSIEAGFPAAATLLIFAVAEQRATSSPLRDLGNFLAFYAAFGLSLASVGEWAQGAAELVTVIPRIERLRPIISTPTEANDDTRPPGDIEGAIEFASVSFRYGDSGPPVLNGIDLSVARGECLAIVGPSGSGKSTLFRLLLGFEKPESGVIFVDGKSLDTIDTGLLRRQVGVVLQNARLSSGSIYDNICGGVQIPIDRVWDIARMAGLERDIEAMPMGMHTFVAEGVNTLSGGQRERVLIARALAHNPRLLLMDEATSALDNRTQAIVTDTISRLGITRIVIAHRLSTVQSADRIVVFDRGRIVQSGSYAELISAPGLFAEFARRQLLQG
jgi:NHLM bacteriocin system ABC transporter ATP-binding protein